MRKTTPVKFNLAEFIMGFSGCGFLAVSTIIGLAPTILIIMAIVWLFRHW